MLENWNNVTVTSIKLAMYVAPGTGTTTHNNRSSHGFAFNASDILKKIYFSDGTILKWEPNNLVYLPKHSTYKIVAKQTGGCWAINFDVLEDLCEPPFKVSFKANSSVLEYFKEATHAWIERPDLHEVKIKKYLYEIIIKTQRESKRQYIPSEKEKLILPAIELIKRNYMKNDLLSFHISH